MTQSVASIVGATRKYSSQCAPLDRLLGGGLKCGHIIELSGPPGCAKEMLATAIVQSFVESKEGVLFVGRTAYPLLLRALLNSCRYAKHGLTGYFKQGTT